MSNLSSTQSHLKIAGIEEGVVILKDGSLAVILKVNPINFDLKNEVEQNSIVAQYQNFLNSLDFPIQIVIRSKRLDLEPYLIELEKRINDSPNELLQIQATDYVSFMRNLVQVANIMSKAYYVVLNYKRIDSSTAKSGIFSAFSKGNQTPTITRSQFNRIRDELNNRANTLAAGIRQIGMEVEALSTQDVIELFYTIYNPDISSTERLVKMENIQTDVVTRGDDPNPPPAQEQPDSSDALHLYQGDERIQEVVGAAEVPAEAEAKAAAPQEPAQESSQEPPNQTPPAQP